MLINSFVAAKPNLLKGSGSLIMFNVIFMRTGEILVFIFTFEIEN